MFTAFNENKFLQALKDKDYHCLKVNAVSAMLDDPTFERGEARRVLEILEKETPEIFDDPINLEYEERLERDEWDKRYFTKLTYWFQENFAKERVDYIEEVGKVVHADTAKKYAESMAINTTAQNKTSSVAPKKNPNPTKASEAKGKLLPIIGAIAAVGALVLTVVVLLKLFQK